MTVSRIAQACIICAMQFSKCKYPQCGSFGGKDGYCPIHRRKLAR